jgi:plasmid stabilization system protein ParE
MTSYILAPEALQDLQELWDYIATENLDAADRVIDTLFAAFERLAAMPGLGHTREDLTDRPLRFWTVDAYLVLYRPGQIARRLGQERFTEQRKGKNCIPPCRGNKIRSEGNSEFKTPSDTRAPTCTA